MMRDVAPFAGAWIEIEKQIDGQNYMVRHSLHGSVD